MSTFSGAGGSAQRGLLSGECVLLAMGCLGLPGSPIPSRWSCAGAELRSIEVLGRCPSLLRAHLYCMGLTFVSFVQTTTGHRCGMVWVCDMCCTGRCSHDCLVAALMPCGFSAMHDLHPRFADESAGLWLATHASNPCELHQTASYRDAVTIRLCPSWDASRMPLARHQACACDGTG